VDPSEVVLLCSARTRPAYLERTLASWARVRGVGRLGGLVLALGPSDREAEQREIIRHGAHAMGLDGRLIIKADSEAAVAAPGMHRPLGEALTFVRDALKPAAVICAEEDIIVSDDVLEYMLWALTEHALVPNLLTVCAHDVGGQGWDIPGIGLVGGDRDQWQVSLSPYFNPWVWATWAGPRLDLLLGTWDWDATSGDQPWNNGYDWAILRLIQRRGLLSVVPEASRSQNIGRDGGYYANPHLFDQTQAASFRRHRDPGTYQLIGDLA
jgi:hypothetical protein